MPQSNSKKIIKITGACWSCGEHVENSGRCKHCGVYFRADKTCFLNPRGQKAVEKPLEAVTEPLNNNLEKPLNQESENFTNEESRCKAVEKGFKAVKEEKSEAVNEPSKAVKKSSQKEGFEDQNNTKKEEVTSPRPKGIVRRIFDEWINI